MEAEKKYKLKAFFWDQFIRPLNSLFNIYNARALIIAIIILNFFTFKSEIIFISLIILLVLITVFEIYKYYTSGKFMDNYRKHKYPEYKKAIKEIRKSKNQPIENPNQEEVSSGEKEEILEAEI